MAFEGAAGWGISQHAAAILVTGAFPIESNFHGVCGCVSVYGCVRVCTGVCVCVCARFHADTSSRSHTIIKLRLHVCLTRVGRGRRKRRRRSERGGGGGEKRNR